MIKDSSKLKEGQVLKVEIESLNDRLPRKILKQLANNPTGKLVGYKMVDGNQFGLVLELSIGKKQWFFEEELSEI
ncbi:DUF2862 domain-containing protein [Prochlorococcus marinus]|uniref:DUF2862 domain-containing protein n=1 Tax=Prochlorococcus marinus (strain MIT 9211) TaxID=93059 RepID=A9B9R8_PROM4|nr:DUF2862 domain-containing protein [Prochlorococcus marinus]ABX08580.1 Hypothetical protein P9211_06491 [Prochlorococcus marinus str. MIT 9211]